MSIKKRMNKQTVGGSYNGILCSHDNGRIIVTHNEVDESYKHNVERKKTDTMYNIMWNRLNQMILIQITKWLSVVLER